MPYTEKKSAGCVMAPAILVAFTIAAVGIVVMVIQQVLT